MATNYSAWGAIPRSLREGMNAYQEAKKATRDEELMAQQSQRQAGNDDLDKRYKEAQIKKLLFEAQGGGKGTTPGGLKLKPGERYNPQTDTVEQVPGSALYQEQAAKHGKDIAGLTSVKQKAGGGIEAIDKFVGTPGALESQFGKGYSGVLTSRMNPDARTNLDNIKASVRSAGLDMMRAGGSVGTMTEREWPMVEQLMANLSNSMSEEEARMQFEKVKAKMQNIKDEAERMYQLEWGNTPYTQQMRTAPGGQQPQMAPPANAGAPGGKRYKIIAVE